MSTLDRPEPTRDRWGRYLLPVPGETKPIPHTRVTTLVKAIDDTSNLAKWQCRMTAIGLTARPDLRALVASHPDDKTTLNRACDDAINAAKAGAAANTGTALHRFAELADLGNQDIDPGEWAPDITAYTQALAAAGATIDPDMIERIIRVPGLTVAGTFDRILTISGERYIADIKTGSIDHSQLTISAQLACYAHGELLQPDGTYTPLEVNQTHGIIIHLPAGKATCQLIWVDLNAGWEIAQLCHTIRTWRKRKDLYTPHTNQPPTTQTAPATDTTLKERRQWLRNRVANLTPTGRAHLNANWPPGIPKGAKTQWTHTQIDTVAEAVTQAETATQAPFQPTDPTLETTTAPTSEPDTTTTPDPRITQTEYDQLKNRFDHSPARDLIQQWATQARTAGTSIAIATNPTITRAARFAAALAAAPHGDQTTRDLIGAIQQRVIPATETTGTSIANLTPIEADTLKTHARALTEGHLKMWFTDEGIPTVETTPTAANPAA